MKNNKGIALLMMLIMISFLAGTVMICAFAIGHEVNDDQRYEITLQRMLEVKRALIGRLADVSGGEDITSCGGFISDYGEPNDTDDFIYKLLSKPSGWQDWYYDDTNHMFWAGYRRERYLSPPAGEIDFRDGWGNLMQVRFNGNQIEIESWGSDGADGAVNSGTYDEDVEWGFYWQRQIQVVVTNNSLNPAVLTAETIYSFQGSAATTGQIQPNEGNPIGVGGNATFDFGSQKFPIGMRKINILEAGTLKMIKMLCLPSGSGTYMMEQIHYPA